MRSILSSLIHRMLEVVSHTHPPRMPGPAALPCYKQGNAWHKHRRESSIMQKRCSAADDVLSSSITQHGRTCATATTQLYNSHTCTCHPCTTLSVHSFAACVPAGCSILPGLNSTAALEMAVALRSLTRVWNTTLLGDTAHISTTSVSPGNTCLAKRTCTASDQPAAQQQRSHSG